MVGPYTIFEKSIQVIKWVKSDGRFIYVGDACEVMLW